MAYVPPNKRSRQEVNSFVLPKTPQSPESPKNPDLNAEELFPTLGNAVVSTSKGSTMNFASSLFIPQPKEEVKKEVRDGWIHIFKENGEIEYKFGENTENYIELMDWIEDENEIKRYAALDKIINRHMEYQEMDLMLNGPEYLECWEVTEYLEEKERERKRLQREAMGSSDESSEGENFD